MFNIFKITNAGTEKDSIDLLGLLVVQTKEGYFLVDPQYMLETPRILSFAPLNDAPRQDGQPLATFLQFPFKQWTWTLNINADPPGELGGLWKNGDLTEEDNWTATGTGTGVPDETEARAASAK